LRRFCQILSLSQAEDGIRGFHVTGVQTCALPIWTSRARARAACTTTSPLPAPSKSSYPKPSNSFAPYHAPPARAPISATASTHRSEERRAGKGRRSWGGPQLGEQIRPTQVHATER